MPRNSAVRVVLADDHVVLRVGLRAFLEEQEDPSLVVVGEASSGEKAIRLVDELAPDLLLLDLTMVGMGGLETTLEIRRRASAVKILILTQHSESIFLRRTLEAGANGYILKSARGEELLSAVRAVVAGGTYVDPTLAADLVSGAQADRPASDEEAYSGLTRREKQVLKLLAEGFKNKEIAASLGVALKTVMAHRFNLSEKLDIHNQSMLTQFAIRVGLIPLQPPAWHRTTRR